MIPHLNNMLYLSCNYTCMHANLPAYLSTSLPIYLPTYLLPTSPPTPLPAYLPTYLTYLHNYGPTDRTTYLCRRAGMRGTVHGYATHVASLCKGCGNPRINLTEEIRCAASRRQGQPHKEPEQSTVKSSRYNHSGSKGTFRCLVNFRG